jgi:predicted transcriptional regulator
VRKINGTYALTEMGGVVTAHLDRLLGTLAIFEKEKEFWKTHDLSGIPPHLRMRIAELRDYRIISSGEEELYDSHSEFQDQVRQSKVVKGFAPIVHPSYPQLFLSLAQKGVEVSLILSANVYAKCERKYGHLLQEFLKSPYANMYVTDKDFKLSFILTNAYFSMALYFLDGRFDTKLDVASFHPSALKWGEDLFIHCLEQSRQVPPP